MSLWGNRIKFVSNKHLILPKKSFYLISISLKVQGRVESSKALSEIMFNCWDEDSENRATFEEFEEKLHGSLEIHNDLYGYIEADSGCSID